jgi:hypothetical protein
MLFDSMDAHLKILSPLTSKYKKNAALALAVVQDAKILLDTDARRPSKITKRAKGMITRLFPVILNPQYELTLRTVVTSYPETITSQLVDISGKLNAEGIAFGDDDDDGLGAGMDAAYSMTQKLLALRLRLLFDAPGAKTIAKELKDHETQAARETAAYVLSDGNALPKRDLKLTESVYIMADIEGIKTPASGAMARLHRYQTAPITH